MGLYSVIVGTGSYIPTKVVKNEDFLKNEFYDKDGKRLGKSNEEIIKKFEEITGIKERRYVTDELVASDISYLAARDALDSSGIDKETLDYILVAHDFGDVKADNRRSDFVPSIASRIKHALQIKNPKTIAKDIAFGCPGWLQGVIDADYFIKSGDYKKIIVIGTETLSRISDPHDIDSMIYSDGAGATILEARESEMPQGILAHAVRSDALNEAYFLWMGKSNSPEFLGNDLLLKMEGTKVYKYAVSEVAGVVKEALDKANLSLENVAKILMHQANDRLDRDVVRKLYKLYGKPETEINWGILPMTISWLGNSSVATIPTMLDLMLKGKLNDHNLNEEDLVVFASVGAGMNINSVVYKMPRIPRNYKKAI
ncbi:MAG: ketoacyl-ACP synthase III [Candidatus Pacearchaeota archaeon]|nr:ketoacyl-ACP synthase III [Candidatus Pacearchaeota archaeon]